MSPRRNDRPRKERWPGQTRSWGGRHERTGEQYHTVPERWDAPALIAEHRALGGTFTIATEPRHHGHYDYRALWYNIADGVRAGDEACVELAVRLIEENLIVSYGGFARARLARSLKHAPLTPSQAARLSHHFLQLLLAGEACHEFQEYLRLWPRVATPRDREQALRHVAQLDVGNLFRQRVERAFSPDVAGQAPPHPQR